MEMVKEIGDRGTGRTEGKNQIRGEKKNKEVMTKKMWKVIYN